MNRKARNSIGGEKEKWEREWRNQKIRVQKMVRESKEAWEQEQVKEIWTCKNRGKQLWKHINKLRGKDKDEEDLEFYENGKKMEWVCGELDRNLSDEGGQYKGGMGGGLVRGIKE